MLTAMRSDNHMINGTKLLNVANMTRGRRDGILKSEKVRKVIKIGPMHLKGVWIPFERALDFANKERLTEKLYPLFVHDIGSLLQNPRTQSTPASGRNNRGDQNEQASHLRTPQSSRDGHHPSSSISLPSQMPQTPHTNGRAGVDRANTFPTPPTSASVMGMGSTGTTYEWNNPIAHVPSSSGLPLEHGLTNQRSMPTTPATTPPDSTLSNGHHYSHGQQQYDHSRSMYSMSNQYGSTHGVGHPPMPQYAQTLHSQNYGKLEMAPPARATSGPTETKQEHEHDQEYNHTNLSFGADRAYGYAPHSAPSAQADNARPNGVRGSPPGTSGSGRATPRTVAAPTPQWPTTYQPLQRPQPFPSSNIMHVMGDNRGTVPSTGYSAIQTAPPHTYPYTNGVNVVSQGKRMRDVDEDEQQDPYARPISQGAESNSDSKRRRTSVSTPLPKSTLGQRR